MEQSRPRSARRQQIEAARDLATAVEKEIQLWILKDTDGKEHLTLVNELRADGIVELCLKHYLAVPFDQENEKDWRQIALDSLSFHLPPVQEFLATQDGTVDGSENESKEQENEKIEFLAPDKQANQVRVVLPPSIVANINKKYNVFQVGELNTCRRVCWMWRSDEIHIAPPKEISIPTASLHQVLTVKEAQRETQIFDLVDTCPADVAAAMKQRWGFNSEAIRAALEGLQGSGTLNPKEVRLVNDRLTNLMFTGNAAASLGREHRSLLRLVFPQACRVEVEKLCGGFSKSEVFRCVSFSFDGLKEHPTVVKTDIKSNLQDEYSRMKLMSPLLGENAPKILALAEGEEYGALKIELCGASWCVPSLSSEASAFIGTFKKLYLDETHRVRKRLSAETVQRDSSSLHLAEQNHLVVGEVETVLGEVFGNILSMGARDKSFIEEKFLFDEGGLLIERQLEKHLFSKSKEDGDLFNLLQGPTSAKLVKEWTGVLDMDACTYFRWFCREVIDKARQDGQTHRRLMGYVHGDLNGENILIDSESIVWLIDFAFSGPGPILMDLTKLESCILFEYTPIAEPIVKESNLNANQVGVTCSPMSRASEKDFAKILAALMENDMVAFLPPVSSLGIKLGSPGSSVLEQAWSAISRIRQYIPTYCDKDRFPLYLHGGRMYHALKALSFRDISLTQKKYALISALGHSVKVMHALLPSSTNSARQQRRSSSILNASMLQHVGQHMLAVKESLVRERVKYLAQIGAQDAFFVDPISRSKLSVLNQCIDIEVMSYEPPKKLDTSDEIPRSDSFSSDGNGAESSLQEHFKSKEKLQEKVREAMQVVLIAIQKVSSAESKQIALTEAQLDIVLTETEQVRSVLDSLHLLPRSEDFLTDYVFALYQNSTRMDSRYIFSEDVVETLFFRLVSAAEDVAVADGREDEVKYLQVLKTILLDIQTDKLFRAKTASKSCKTYIEKLSSSFQNNVNMASDRRIVVLGAPAAGKSVLLRKLAVFGSLYQKGSNHDALVPLRVLLIDMGRLVTKFNMTPDDDLLEAYLEAKYGFNSSKTWFLKRSFAAGRLVLLLDGFDEAGTAGEVILKWLTKLLRRYFEQRVVITSREVGFVEHLNNLRENGFIGVKLQPLTDKLINTFVLNRVMDGVPPSNKRLWNERSMLAKHLQDQLKEPEFAALAESPLIISFFIHVLTNVEQSDVWRETSPADSSTDTGALRLPFFRAIRKVKRNVRLTRARLYRLAIEQMLRRSDATKYRRRSGKADKLIESDFDLLEDEMAMTILQHLALLAHSNNRRDIFTEDFLEVVNNFVENTEEDTWLRTVSVVNALSRSITRNHVPLFQVRAAGVGQAVLPVNRVLKFVHLTIQEHLAAEAILNRLVAVSVSSSTATTSSSFRKDAINVPYVHALCSEYFGGNLLEKPWWTDVFFSFCEIAQETGRKDLLQVVFRCLFDAGISPAFGADLGAWCVTRKALEKIWLATASSGNTIVLQEFLHLREAIWRTFGLENYFQIMDDNKNTCLHLAAEHKRAEYLVLLLSYFPEIRKPELAHLQNAYQWNPSGLALCNNSIECFRLLSPAQTDNDILQEDDACVPHIIRAVRDGDLQLVMQLLEADPQNLFATTNTRMTPTMWAAAEGQVEILSLLVELDSSESFKTARSRSGVTCLWFAVEQNAVECVKFLLEAGMDPKEKHPTTKDTLLLVATLLGLVDICRILIDAGMNPSDAILVAAIQGRSEFVEEYKAYVNEVATDGITPLFGAILAGHRQTAELLLDVGADVNCAADTMFGTCALHLAVDKGHLECIKLLIERGANINEASCSMAMVGSGKTALAIARDSSHDIPNRDVIVQFLEANGAKVWSDMTLEEQDRNSRRAREMAGK